MDESPVTEGVSIITRPFDPEHDAAMVYSTWRNSAYYSALIQPEEDNDHYFKQLTFAINRILKSARVKIACLEDAPSIIVGYVVFTGTHLDWIYVKSDYRNKGIATLLCPKNIKSVTWRMTRAGAEILKRKKMIVKGDD